MAGPDGPRSGHRQRLPPVLSSSISCRNGVPAKTGPASAGACSRCSPRRPQRSSGPRRRHQVAQQQDAG